ncbi:hypothetical protein NBRC111894_3096 [Sporolactobacillus inulinus]|uniref:Uncharacterized protein n=1 Tax=Sporolactobacillus inulinus TaxID=2078 RepID=A0A4Y1ZEE5_9BACL|nr:hypothetical protein NBRC111894_3096 [Sporolactobacillus inulinus]
MKRTLHKKPQRSFYCVFRSALPSCSTFILTFIIAIVKTYFIHIKMLKNCPPF